MSRLSNTSLTLVTQQRVCTIGFRGRFRQTGSGLVTITSDRQVGLEALRQNVWVAGYLRVDWCWLDGGHAGVNACIDSRIGLQGMRAKTVS